LVSLAAVLHAMVTTVAALLVIAVGAVPVRGLMESTGRPLRFLSGVVLLVFGLGYGIYAHLREARVHGHGSAAGASQAADHVHAHGHLLERWFRGALSGGALVAVVGISPCALLVPVLLAAAAEGPVAFAAAGSGFLACTLLTMVGVAASAAHGMRRLDLPLFSRFGDLASGVLIAAIGLLVMHQER
jgi:threonine/homoserine/homoserine lactone efflux protein